MHLSSQIYKCNAKIYHIHHILRRERVVVRVLLVFFTTVVVGKFFTIRATSPIKKRPSDINLLDMSQN